ncbi:hypothetical protein [Streptomyces lydicus]|uniref:hypothetical protein n=1 Tax=Streptomyces lydicus TaxID=47763 RepID=UPI0010136BA3|nr:hypothetical protein [Streptomyces lydicus]MCZ1012659.1 hypothetical protein [Streptomyces lydicus]
MDSLITHQFIGPTPAGRRADLGGGVPADRCQHGDRLTTPDGNLLTVIALHGTQVMSAIAFEQV